MTVVHLYTIIKRIMIGENRFRNKSSAYNFRLELPARNISTEEEAREIYEKECKEFPEKDQK